MGNRSSHDETAQTDQSDQTTQLAKLAKLAKPTTPTPGIFAPAALSTLLCHAFEVEPGIQLGSVLPCPTTSLQHAWSKFGIVEAMSAPPKQAKMFFTQQNLFAQCVSQAFFDHLPLRFSPDVVWHTILQGLANHVNANPETLRSKFVAFQGKTELLVSRPDFVKSSVLNYWPGVFGDFAQQIEANTHAGLVQLLQADFSTTCEVSRIVSQIALMDTVKSYFEYSMAAGCGFPRIELSGTVADWEHLRAKAEQLSQFDLDFWLVVLLPVLDEFVLAAKHTPNLAFWRSLVTTTGASAMPGEPVTGWLQAFFPYLNASGYTGQQPSHTSHMLKKNTGLANYQESMKNNVNLANKKFGSAKRCGTNYEGMKSSTPIELFPPSISTAPVNYVEVQTRQAYSMAFYGGITTIVQHDDLTLECALGWAVIELPD